VGFHEQGRYVLSIDTNASFRLLIDEVEPPRVPHSGGIAWEWLPGFYAGVVKAELIDGGGTLLASYLFDVSPNPHKLGSEQFQAMLDEIFEFDPRLLTGSEAATFGIGAQGNVTDPHLEYSRLRRYAPYLLDALDAITRRPLTQLVYDRAAVPAHQVRRLDVRSITSIARSPTAIAKLKGNARLDGGQQTLFDVARSRQEVDVPANRTIHWMLYAVLRRTRLVIEALNEMAEKEKKTPTRTELSPRMEYRREFLADLELRLRRAAKKTPFSVVTRGEVSAAGLNVISAHPLYSRAFGMGWRILRPGIAGESEGETLWMSTTWEIYERWCFLTIFRALKLTFPTLSWERTYPSSREDCIVFCGRHGGTTTTLYYQPRFPAYDQLPWQSFSSISGERYPDVVITHVSAEQKAFLVFDAKYRTSRKNVLEAMESAHLYRDSLRWNGIPPDKVLLVIPARGGVPWLERADFWEENGVGVYPVAPTIELRSLSDSLSELINHVSLHTKCDNPQLRGGSGA
jgi:hypothetical protein